MFASAKLWENGAAAQRTAIQIEVSTKEPNNISKHQAMPSEEGKEKQGLLTRLLTMLSVFLWVLWIKWTICLLHGLIQILLTTDFTGL